MRGIRMQGIRMWGIRMYEVHVYRVQECGMCEYEIGACVYSFTGIIKTSARALLSGYEPGALTS